MLIAAASHSVSATDPYTAVVLVACAVVAAAMIGLVGVALATAFGRG